MVFTMADINKGRLANLSSYIQKGKVSSISEKQSKARVMIFSLNSV